MNSERTTTKKSRKRSAALIAISAMYAALLVGGKEALAALPNIEVVTIFTAVCAYCWGIAVVLPAVNVFIAVDMAIWGVNTWIISYFIYWNALALCFWALSKARFGNKAVEILCTTALAVALTTLFGVITTAVDTLVGFTGRGFFFDFDNVVKRFAAMYVAGAPFFITHVACNFALFAAAFLPLVMLNRKAKLRIWDSDGQSDGQTSEQTNDQTDSKSL